MGQAVPRAPSRMLRSGRWTPLSQRQVTGAAATGPIGRSVRLVRPAQPARPRLTPARHQRPEVSSRPPSGRRPRRPNAPPLSAPHHGLARRPSARRLSTPLPGQPAPAAPVPLAQASATRCAYRARRCRASPRPGLPPVQARPCQARLVRLAPLVLRALSDMRAPSVLRARSVLRAPSALLEGLARQSPPLQGRRRCRRSQACRRLPGQVLATRPRRHRATRSRRSRLRSRRGPRRSPSPVRMEDQATRSTLAGPPLRLRQARSAARTPSPLPRVPARTGLSRATRSSWYPGSSPGR